MAARNIARRSLRAIRNAYMQMTYGEAGGYNAEKYWDWRHTRFSSDVRAVGSGDPAELSNRYPRQRETLFALLIKCGVQVKDAKCVEFGSGNGFWANAMLEKNAGSYIGFDISSTAVKNAAVSVPKASFRQADLGLLNSTFEAVHADIVFAIDVLQHLTGEDRVTAFLSNLVLACRPGGYVVLTSYIGHGNRLHNSAGTGPLWRRFFRPLAYVNSWDQEFIAAALRACELLKVAEFWDKHILLFRKHST